MRTLLKTYLVFTLLFFAAVVGGYYYLVGGAFGMPANMDWMQFAIGMGAVHVLVAFYGMGLGGRKQAGRLACMIMGLILGVLALFIIPMMGGKKLALESAASGRRR